MQIRKHSQYVFDVFQGTGFDQWTRVRRFHWGFKVIGGIRLDRQSLESLSIKLTAHPNGGIESVA